MPHQNNAPPADPEHKQLHLEPQEIPVLLNVAMAEVVFGFQRATEGGTFQWWGPDLTSGEPDWRALEALPNVAGDIALAMDVFTRMAIDHGMIPSIMIDNTFGPNAMENPVHVSLAQRVDAHTMQRRAKASGPTIPHAICWAVLGVYQPDLAQLHRDLFPARYLQVVQ